MPRRPPLVLAYHGVAAVPIRRDRAGLFVAPSALARHIKLLRRWGYGFTTFGELASRAAAGDADGHVALTFDDGFADNLHTLVPLLAAESVPATVFVVPTWDGLPHPDAPWARTLTGAETRALAGAGVEIGSHSLAHRDLSTLEHDETRDDFARSRAALEEVLDRSVDVAAYPFGRVGTDTARACREAGFRAACRITGEGSWDDPWNIPRQDMNNGSGVLGLWLKRDDRYEALVGRPAGRLLRGVTRRAKDLVA